MSSTDLSARFRADISEIKAHLINATALLSELEAEWIHSLDHDEAPANVSNDTSLATRSAQIAPRRNPDHFRETGHLSDAGIAAIYALFDQGLTIEEAAKAMHISVRGAAHRRSAWQKLKRYRD